MGTQCHLSEYAGYTSTSSFYPGPVAGANGFLH